MRNKVTVTLKNGREVTAYPEDLVRAIEIASTPEPVARVPMYFSRSKGTSMRIKDMNSVHIRNAIDLHYREWMASLKNVDTMTPREYIRTLFEGPVHDAVIRDLVAELATRRDWRD